MSLYKLDGMDLSQVAVTTFAVAGIPERKGLQSVLREHIEVVAPDTLVIAEEFQNWEGSQRRIDLLAIDKDANVVVIELKRDETGSHMELQALRYAAMVARITFDQAVSAFGDYLLRLGRGEDARDTLLEFLGWEEPDESGFAQDVRIVLVSADFSRELTSTVMWLNERDLDIRCVQLRPHRHGADLLLDVQQVIPLPEASDYQVQVREKARRERAERKGDMRDLTRYDLTVFGVRYPAKRKRRAVLQAVRSLSEAGVHPDTIAPHLKHPQPFVREKGDLDHQRFVERMEEAYRRGEGPRPRAYLTKDDELIRSGGETFALSKGWGTNTVPTLENLRCAFPQAAIEYLPADAE